jgi:hypothetical protein
LELAFDPLISLLQASLIIDIWTAIRAFAEVRLTLAPSFIKVMASLGFVTVIMIEFPTDAVSGAVGAWEFTDLLPGMELATAFLRNSNEKAVLAAVTPPLIFQVIK